MKIPNPFKKKGQKSDNPFEQKKFTLQDIIAPKELEVDFNNLRVNDNFFRTYFVSGYPRFVEPNWLEPLVS